MPRLPDLYARIGPRVAHSRGALFASRTHACSACYFGGHIDVLLMATFTPEEP